MRREHTSARGTACNTSIRLYSGEKCRLPVDFVAPLYDRAVRALHVEELGRGPRVVLVHGSVTNGAATWGRQRPLADRFRLEIVTRPGFPPNPPLERVDFELDAPIVAEQLGDGAHLAGHSYGGIVCLLAAALRPDAVRSLTVIEPPCLGVAADVPAVEAFVEEYEHDVVPVRDPRERLERFFGAVGSAVPLPDPLPPSLEQGARAQMVERGPHEAVVPFEALRAAPFPKLVVSGAHHTAFDAVCDVLERELPAERAVIAGGGHAAQRVGDAFNERLADFLGRADERLSAR
jgi:pimeloyl-ACP methyl ester carboxylesterase